MSIKEKLDAVRKGVENISKAKPEPVNANSIILARFLDGFSAADHFAPGVSVITTDQIISELGDMADISRDEVNSALAVLGYTPGRNSVGSFGWLMKRNKP